ncbi:MAG: hypothetical protein WBP86_06425 [Thiobacillaceae bacterium]
MTARSSYALHFSHLPMSQRLVYTMALLTLGVGYMFAMIQVFVTHTGLDGKSGLTVADLRIAYSGKQGSTRLETALMGPMQSMLPADERKVILTWAASDASKEGWEQKVKPIMDSRCISCHNGSDPHRPNLTTWDGVSQMVSKDTGMSIATLVRVSHIHLFGLTFIFFIVSSVFTHAYVKPLWFKCTVIVLPFLAIIMDIGSWYLTKFWPGLAVTVIISGALMGLSFVVQWVTSMYQMWLYKPPAELQASGGAIPTMGGAADCDVC